MESLESVSLPNLLYEAIEKFQEYANRHVKERNPKDFHMQLATWLGIIRFSLSSLCNQETTSDAIEITMNDIAALLENSLKKKAGPHGNIGGFENGHIIHRYPKLFALRRSRDFSAIYFGSDARSRELLIARLSGCVRNCSQELPHETLEVIVHEDAQQKLPEAILDQANHLHEMLTRYWGCTCLVTSHKISLSLASMDCPQSTDGYMKFNLLFASSDEHCSWQEGEISVDMRRQVRLDALQSRVTSKKIIVSCGEESTTANTLCRLIQKAQKNQFRLCLQIDENAMSSNGPRPKEVGVQSKESLLLSQITDIVESGPPTADINRLAYVLACTLLQLYDDDPNAPDHWISHNWIKRDGIWKTPKWTEHVCFYYRSDLDIQQPYLLSQTNGPPLGDGPPIDDPDDLEYALHSAPGILALGKALLELQIATLGLPLEPTLDSEVSQTGPQINTDFYQADGLLKAYEDNLKVHHYWFYKAINACLDLNPDETLSVREYIYKHIVIPLELNYRIHSPSPELIEKQLEDIRERRENAIVKGSVASDDVYIYGDEELHMHPREKQLAEGWFKWLSNVHTKVSGAEDRRSKMVKIAILDTGIELSESQKEIYEEDSEFIYKSWVDDNEEGFDSGKDDVGHGTHLATLLKKVARYAIVHVARVFKARKPNMATEVKNVAQAIRHAVDVWDVDIITMSFGFKDEQHSKIEEESIREAIRYAHLKDVTLFAAASNDGDNRPDGVAWPARAAEVICVHAADGSGSPKYSPGADDGQRVMVLGEYVQSAWPQRVSKTSSWKAAQAGDSQAPTEFKYMSGTSCAAAIAAGIAAIVLDYAQFLTQDEWKRIRRVDGMKKMFKIMKKSRPHGYWWVCPWFLFRDSADHEWIKGQMRMVLQDL